LKLETLFLRKVQNCNMLWATGVHSNRISSFLQTCKNASLPFTLMPRTAFWPSDIPSTTAYVFSFYEYIISFLHLHLLNSCTALTLR